MGRERKPVSASSEQSWVNFFFDLENGSLSANLELKDADGRPTVHSHFLDQISQLQTQNFMGSVWSLSMPCN